MSFTVKKLLISSLILSINIVNKNCFAMDSINISQQFNTLQYDTNISELNDLKKYKDVGTLKKKTKELFNQNMDNYSQILKYYQSEYKKYDPFEKEKINILYQEMQELLNSNINNYNTIYNEYEKCYKQLLSNKKLEEMQLYVKNLLVNKIFINKELNKETVNKFLEIIKSLNEYKINNTIKLYDQIITTNINDSETEYKQIDNSYLRELLQDYKGSYMQTTTSNYDNTKKHVLLLFILNYYIMSKTGNNNYSRQLSTNDLKEVHDNKELLNNLNKYKYSQYYETILVNKIDQVHNNTLYLNRWDLLSSSENNAQDMYNFTSSEYKDTLDKFALKSITTDDWNETVQYLNKYNIIKSFDIFVNIVVELYNENFYNVQ